MVGLATGLAGWALAILAGRAADGGAAAAATDSHLTVPYLAFAAICAAGVAWAIRRSKATA